MCGRFQFTCENNPKLAEKICQLKQNYPQYSISTGEIFPTNSALVALEQQGKIVIGIQYWGFPHFKKVMSSSMHVQKPLHKRNCFRTVFFTEDVQFYPLVFMSGTHKNKNTSFTIPIIPMFI